MNPKVGFELFDHTADIGANLHGEVLADIFETGAKSMFSIIFHNNIPDLEPRGEYQIKLHCLDLEQLLVDWLDEILFIFATEKIIFSNYKINVDEANFKLDAYISGGIVPDDMLKGVREIKAVTYHMLKIKKTKARWEAQVLFDI